MELRRRRKVSRFGCRGAAMVEFALSFPLFIFLVMSLLQLGLVMAKRAALDDALRSTGRLVATLPQGADCAAEALSSLRRELSAANLPFDLNGFSWADQGSWPSMNGAQRVKLEARIPIPCMFCRWIGVNELRSSAVVIMENEDAC